MLLKLIRSRGLFIIPIIFPLENENACLNYLIRGAISLELSGLLIKSFTCRLDLHVMCVSKMTNEERFYWYQNRMGVISKYSRPVCGTRCFSWNMREKYTDPIWEEICWETRYHRKKSM